MANVLFTNVCNRRCPYCFAQEKIGPGSAFLPFDVYVTILDFLSASGDRSFSALGGEPTLHPEFTGFIRYALQRGFAVRVFTNGLCRADVLRDLAKLVRDFDLTQENFGLVVNVNEERLQDSRERDAQSRFLDELGRYCTLSFNLYRADFEADHLLELVREHRAVRRIRIGVAQPIADGRNEFLPVADYPAAVRRLVEFAGRCDSANVSLSLDCGFPLCAFSEGDLGLLVRSNAMLAFKCNPCVDIGTDGRVWHCFPMAAASTSSIGDFADMAALRAQLEADVRRSCGDGGIYPNCASCRHKARGQCAGGCRAHALRIA